MAPRTGPGTRRGFFLSVEGMDGCGKTTQVGRLAQALGTAGRRVLVVRDPGTTALGERLRQLLLEPVTDWALEPWAEAALFLAARIQLARETILPALEAGVTVIADRYLDSSLVYQGARGVPTAPLLEIHRLCGLDRVPDLTLLLDLEVESARSRRREGENIDRLEAEPTPYHERVRAGYLELARRFPERIKVVGAERDPDAVTRDCLEMVRARMST